MSKALTKERIGLFLGPLLFLLVWFVLPLAGLSPEGRAVLASTAWIAVWWITEAIPIAATALLPLVLFPLTGAINIKQAATGYSHPFIFLFLGGFILAIAIEKWNLHRRIALSILSFVGNKKKFIILGFMIGTGFLSMWISNTATAAMMLPIGMALVTQIGKDSSGFAEPSFGKALMLGIAYSASIGGTATLIGTPPNLILAGVIQTTYGVEISFFQWFSIGLPFAAFMLFVCWYYLVHIAFRFNEPRLPGGKAELRKQMKSLGKISRQEKTVLVIFITTGLAWMLRSYILEPFLPAIDDTIIAISAAFLLFVLPSGKSGERILVWEDTLYLPWSALLLFGGGIALANGFEISGLATWIGHQFNDLQSLHIFLLVLVVIAAVNFLTEITSNLATTAMILPILGSLAVVADVHPFVLMVGAGLAASCAFMLPVATPPNAIVYGSGKVSITDMIRAGFGLNILSILILTLLVYLLLPLIWGIEIRPFPIDLKMTGD